MLYNAFQLLNYLQGFLRNATGDIKDYAMYARRILKRTEVNGTRYHPPNWLEIQVSLGDYVDLYRAS